MARAAFWILLPAFVLSTSHCFGQRLVLCTSGLNDSLSCPAITMDMFLGKGGRRLSPDAALYQDQILISRVCALGGGAVLVGFGNEHSNGEAFTLRCGSTTPNTFFNRYQNGVRDGLWFQQNVFGVITRAAEYREGELQSVLHFWSNGLPRKRVFYKEGRLSAAGQKRYTRKGYPLNGMMPF